jgi:hypothetical protein
MSQIVESFYGLFRSSSGPNSVASSGPNGVVSNSPNSEASNSPNSKLHKFSSDTEKQKYATDLSRELLPPIYHEMCGDTAPLGEMDMNRESRLFHCNNLRTLLAQAVYRRMPVKHDVHYHIRELANLGEYPVLDTVEEQQTTYTKLATFATRGNTILTYNITNTDTCDRSPAQVDTP